MNTRIIYGLAAGLLFIGFGCTPNTPEVTSETAGTQGSPEEQDAAELQMMEYLGPQYFIDCGDGRVLTGYYRYDEELERIDDENGNGLDRDTGLPVSCG